VYAPRELQLFDELPRTSIGKVRRAELTAAVLARSAT
jgi:acyl-coenzyme A synthetase/AMP-(fatty) acid ligase